jgi:very-short-patch-repair endonuclease
MPLPSTTGPADDPPDRRIARVAARQRGLITREQLRALGIGDRAISRRIACGRLHRVFRGVYRVGHEAPAPHSRELAALMAVGAGCVLSFDAAAHPWRLRDEPPATIDITTTRRGPGSREGITVHRVRALAAADWVRHEGLLVTSPARTVVDLASRMLDAEDVAALLDRAAALRLTTPTAIRGALARRPDTRGTRLLREAVAESAPFTRSRAERMLRSLVVGAGLPAPRTNTKVCGFEVDAHWPEAGLVVEFDSWTHHRSRAAFERDRRRDVILQLSGMRVLRVTWRRLTGEPEAVAAEIAQALTIGR